MSNYNALKKKKKNWEKIIQTQEKKWRQFWKLYNRSESAGSNESINYFGRYSLDYIVIPYLRSQCKGR